MRKPYYFLDSILVKTFYFLLVLSQYEKDVVNKSGKTFVPHGGPKTTVTNSVINQNVMRSLNPENFKSVAPNLKVFTS